MNKPIVLTKVSLRYSPVEDRINMSGRIGESGVMVFWLTLRICQKLVGALSQFIEKSTAVPSGSDKELVLSFQQSAAMVRNDSADPVVADNDAKSVLVERIDLTFKKESVLLAFFMPDGGVAHLTLALRNARQWLGILRDQYRQAEWPMDAWPTWFAESADRSVFAEKSARMH